MLNMKTLNDTIKEILDIYGLGHLMTEIPAPEPAPIPVPQPQPEPVLEQAQAAVPVPQPQPEPALEQVPAPDPQPTPAANPSPPPFISYVTFNRLGLTIKNLNNILDSNEDFEMHIIDCNSKDNTWDYINSLQDERIQSKTRFDLNRGPIYVLNYNLAKRKPNQYFITIDSDVYIKTKNWISRFIEVFEAFPNVGLLGLTRDNPYPRHMPPIIPRVNGNAAYLELRDAQIGGIMDFVPGSLQVLRPELITEIGYWSEENGYGDAELSPRITHYTSFKAGFITTVEIDMTQSIGCDECQGQEICALNKSIKTCYMLSKQANMNDSFVGNFKWKYLETFKEMAEGGRSAYCASINDPASIVGHKYNHEWANENFGYYISRSN
ncbi:glycosyl transferase family 2 [Syntrophobotulus glycolicus DSM 8271]|uniref:Glycosyl transferase family 2 n=1 Tax=Syntrophobotulus glycolicus (strain DSM 8271 / FlGlyR) TaxID=645991 RepID=F0SXN4_SYNGF|nr:glycosyl transferase family 2 [Syntrophobotulus glycolicus DSM 8271]